jgi:2-aminoadipate transaminase
MAEISLASGSLGQSPVLEKILSKALRGINPRDLLDYGDTMGLPELRQVVAGLHGGKVSPENILITSSSQQALFLITEIFLTKKDFVYLQSPTFMGMLRVVKNLNVVTFEGGCLPPDYRVGPRTAFYLTSNFHNPSAQSLEAWKKEALSAMAKKGSLVIEDNPYDLLYYDEKPTTILSLSMENVIYVCTFSKMLAPGLRLGYVVAEAEKIKQLKSRKINLDLSTSTLSQLTALACLKEPEYLVRLREEFRKKRDLALLLLDSYFCDWDLVSWIRPEGSIFILLTLDERISAAGVQKRAQEKGLILEEDKYLYRDGQSRNTIRLNFVQNSQENLEEAMELLAQSVKEERNAKS